MNEKKSKKILKSIFGFSLPTWINAAIGILAVPLVTRLFEPDVLGKFNLFHTYSTILYCITLFGLNQGLMRFYNEPPGRNSSGGLYKLCQSIIVLTTAIVAVVIFVFGKQFSFAIADEYSFFVLICLALYVASAAFLNLTNSLFRMQNSLIAYGTLTILMNLCAKITYAGAALVDDQFTGAITLLTGSYIIITVIYMIWSLVRYKNEKFYYGKEEISPLFKYSLPLMPVLFISQLNASLPNLFIKEYLDNAQVGIYTSAAQVVSIIAIVQSGINIFWAPFVFENYAENQKRLSSGHTMITLLMVIFGLGVVLFQDIFYLIIGENYRSSQQFFALLLFSPICYTISETTGIGINISKRTYLNIFVYGTAVVITLTLCYLLIPIYGLYGAAIAVASAAFAMLIVKTIFGERFYKVVTYPIKTFSAPALFLLVGVLNTVFFDIFWLRTIITITGGALVCLIYRREMISLINMIVRFIKPQPQGE